MSNKLLFSKALLKKDFKILSATFIFNVILIIVSIPFQYSQAFYTIKNVTAPYEVYRTLTGINNILSYLYMNIVFACIYALKLFGHEKQTKAFEMIVSLPFSRIQIFINKVVVGLFVLLVPSILGYIISYFIILSEPISRGIIDMSMNKYIFLNTLSMQLVIFFFYVTFCMIFSNSISSFIFGSICAFMPAGFSAVIELFFNSDSTTNITEFLFRFTPISIIVSFGFVKYSYVYIILLAVLFMIISYLLFDMTKMEKLTEFLTFKCLETPFRIIFFLGFAFLGGVVLSGIFSSFVSFEFLNKIIGFTVGGALGYFIPKTIITKSRIS